jgi:hypothetical protein
MGQSLYTYEGTAATNQNLPSAMAPTSLAVSNFVGADGAFTFEALVCPAFGLGSIPNDMQIISGEHDSSRGWQFRVASAGNLVFIKLTGTVQTITTPLPSDGVHAFAANKWFHVAVTYNGQADTDGNLKFYWTALDAKVSEAVQLGAFRLAADLDPAVTPFFVVGNEGRSGNGRTENWEGWIDEVRISDIALSPADMVPLVDTGAASSPVPANHATDLPRAVVLSWTPGESAVTSDVYLGTSPDDVGDVTGPPGVRVSRGQDANSYDAGRLEFGQTYCWRIDGVGAAPDYAVSKGSVWSFAIEPYSYPIQNVTATASSVNKATDGPEKTVDGSGLNADDQHSVFLMDMWLSKKNAPEPAWIEFAFDRVYKLDRMLVWNSNQEMESSFGVGAKDVKVEYSMDRTNWTALGDFEFAQAPGEDTYVSDITVEFAGVTAKYVKLTISSNHLGILKQYGLSEVRFLYKPVWARSPDPADGATSVHPQVALNWRPGREAGSHQVYLGVDKQAVVDGTALAGTTSEPRHGATLDLARTYFWKVTEVNQIETPTAWEGDVWSFSTTDFITIDNFEAYTSDSPNRVFQTWVDGSGFSEDDFFPTGNPGNGTGALVGYDPLAGSIMETGLVHGGTQSMPLYYDNGAAPRYSEAVRSFDPPQDWSKHGITTLVLYFRGDVNNVSAPVYVKINGTKVVYNNGAASTTTPVWKQWNIDLASIAGVNLKSIKTLTIGVGDGTAGASGMIFVDEIRLYRVAPQVVAPVDPGTNGLAALYAMENNVQDTSGKNLHGTANGNLAYVQGPPGYGKALAFDGVNAYVDLPIGSLLSTLTSVTIATQVNFSNTGGTWQRIFDFGTGTTNYMFLTPRTGTTGPVRFAIRTASVDEQFAMNEATLPSGWHHMAVVIDSGSMQIRLYVDGTMAASGTTTLLPKDLGSANQNWLGRSQWTNDAYFTGSLDDFRIYNRVLSESEVRYLAGDR